MNIYVYISLYYIFISISFIQSYVYELHAYTASGIQQEDEEWLKNMHEYSRKEAKNGITSDVYRKGLQMYGSRLGNYIYIYIYIYIYTFICMYVCIYICT
jgi:hypothetical protein